MTKSHEHQSLTSLKKRLRDVTTELEQTKNTLKASIAERERLEIALKNADSLSLLEQMAATIAHEVRNPLGGIAGFAALLERDLDMKDPRRRLVKRIIEGVSTLNDIVTNLVTYTRPIQLNYHTVDLIALVEQVVTLFELRAEQEGSDIRVDRRYAEDHLICSIDSEQFQHVLLNLLDNAVQAMVDGGDLSVDVSREKRMGGQSMEEENGGSVQWTDEDGGSGRWVNDQRGTIREEAVIRISDSGSGIPDPIKAQLFVPFITTKENGTGLGLAIARRIIDAHSGTITVESEPGLGSLFIIRIPI